MDFYLSKRALIKEQDAKRLEFLNLALPKISANSCTSLSLSFSLCKARRLGWILLQHLGGSDFVTYVAIKVSLRQNGQVYSLMVGHNGLG